MQTIEDRLVELSGSYGIGKGSISWRWLHQMLCPGLCAALLLGPSEGSASVILEYRCTPDIKHECTAAGCETMSSDSGFQQAESFVYSPETGQLSACLWTNCYAGSATVFAGTATDTFTVVGQLLPVRPGNEPVIVTLTIKTPLKAEQADDEHASFTAAWGYGGEGLAVDIGECVLSR
jgi:hypothetical protein